MFFFYREIERFFFFLFVEGCVCGFFNVYFVILWVLEMRLCLFGKRMMVVLWFKVFNYGFLFFFLRLEIFVRFLVSVKLALLLLGGDFFWVNVVFRFLYLFF